MADAETPIGKGERTKERIVQAALDLFREHGYEATTMRMVADRAGVSLGNAYYYFESKDLLLQAFYREVHEAHVAAAAAVLQQERTLVGRLRGVMLAKLEVIEPYHRFSSLMFRTAADPASPLNPFHPAGADTRAEGEALFAEVLRGSRIQVPKELAAELPRLLWTYSMGMVLYWIHDRSPQRARTRAFVEQTADLIASSIKLASNPLLRPLRTKVLGLLHALQPGDRPSPG
ncbi:MAG TPA: TetR family transcriptional regulator [Planctomycetota bacterium]|nr:TetR family transcriptional regulator [Planctomycetota bacterium]